MTYTLIFKDDKPYLRECATMEKPKPLRYGRDGSYQYAVNLYNEYLASLPCYPLLNKPESWKEGMQIEEGMVRKEYEVLRLIDKDSNERDWMEAYWKEYDLTHPDMRRIIFTPSEQVGGGGEEEDDKKEVVEILEAAYKRFEDIGDELHEVGKNVKALLFKLTGNEKYKKYEYPELP